MAVPRRLRLVTPGDNWPKGGAMKEKEIWRSGGARATVALDDGLLRVTYSGPITLASWGDAAECADLAAGGRAVALLADFTRAAVTISPAELGGVRPVRTALTRRNLPGAMVVPGIHFETYQALAWELALQGIERAVFTSRAGALAWALALVRKRRAWGLAPAQMEAPAARCAALPRRSPAPDLSPMGR